MSAPLRMALTGDSPLQHRLLRKQRIDYSENTRVLVDELREKLNIAEPAE